MDDIDDKDELNNHLSEKELMIIGDLIEKMKTILHDRDSLNILAELLINQKLSFDGLKNKLKSLNENKLNSKLSYLLDSDLIESKDNDYFLSILKFQDLLDNTKRFRESANLLRESRIAYQILFQILLNHELDILSNTSSSDYKKNYQEETVFDEMPYLSFLLVNKEIFNKYKKKLEPIYKELSQEIAKGEQQKPLGTIGPFLIYNGFLYFPELDMD